MPRTAARDQRILSRRREKRARGYAEVADGSPTQPLQLTGALADTFLGALLTIARADGVVNEDELDELRRIGQSLGAAEELLVTDVGPDGLARALDGVALDPYRDPTGTTPHDVAAAFVGSARRIALADGELHAAEDALTHAFADSLGVTPSEGD